MKYLAASIGLPGAGALLGYCGWQWLPGLAIRSWGKSCGVSGGERPKCARDNLVFGYGATVTILVLLAIGVMTLLAVGARRFLARYCVVLLGARDPRHALGRFLEACLWFAVGFLGLLMAQLFPLS